MSTALLVTTTPREIESRWVRSGDQVAVFATHYDPAHTVTPVRTTDVAKMPGLVAWWTVHQPPMHLSPEDTGAGPAPAEPHSGFLLTLVAPPSDTLAGKPVELWTGDHEQIVIREAVAVEPWDLECCGLEGACYLPTGHDGPCDPDQNPALTPERES